MPQCGGDGAFFNWPDRLSVDTIEGINKSLLTYLCQCLDRYAIYNDIKQVRGGRKIVIPQTMVNGLEVPDFLASTDVDCDDGFGEQIITRAMSAIVIISGSAGG